MIYLRDYELTIPMEELQILQDMVGSTLDTILCRAMDYNMKAEMYLLDFHVYLSIGSSYVQLAMDWRETEDGDDYWRVVVKKNSFPSLIPYEIERNGSVSFLGDKSSDITVFSKIEKVEVYSAELKFEDERQHYDSILIVTLANNKRLCFTNSIPDLVQLTWTEEKIKELTNNCFLKHSFTNIEGA
ncbi:hypothetical protein KO561_06930 [Radiobacillus kanasensis]|uniref:hypothetical protein n=1 Tax=Radiobacillus kanasensis TaxID=2844358 RepID=UPI001E580859|nr:hypothetical protein [Radiobacillus kanasensis]UFU00662.1 hypothetical protein KO561_06930 [Radiobacillus kanasensis]